MRECGHVMPGFDAGGGGGFEGTDDAAVYGIAES